MPLPPLQATHRRSVATIIDKKNVRIVPLREIRRLPLRKKVYADFNGCMKEKFVKNVNFVFYFERFPTLV